MIKYILLIAITVIPFLGSSQTLVPEAVWIDGNHRDWSDKGIGTTFLSFNGILYAFNYQGNGNYNGGHAYMYTINAGNKTTQDELDDVKMDDFKLGPSNDHNNKIEFMFPGEYNSKDEGAVLGRTFAFQFEGRAWYFQHIRSAASAEPSGTRNESYECFAEFPTSDANKCYTYYNTVSPASTNWKQGGFQLDSLMYFLSFNADKKYWEIQENYYSGNKRFQGTGSDFTLNPYIDCVGNYLGVFDYLGGLVRRLDSLGNQYFVATFYNPGNFYVFGKIVPEMTNDKRSFTWEEILAEPDPPVAFPYNPGTRAFPFYIGATALAEGSFKGNRTTSDIPNKEQSDRLVLFGESNTKSSDGYYHVAYCEYHFENDLLVKDASGNITLPSSRGPSKVSDDYHLYATYQLKPMDYTTMLPGTDGYQSYMWLLYPDHDRNFNGAMFLSDSWRQDPELFEESTDLDKDSSYFGIRDLWSLMGIIDGSPPISMNWEKWHEHWGGFPVPATLIEFESDSSVASEFLTSTEHEWSIGQSLQMSVANKVLKAQMGEKFKYSQTYENTVSHSQSNSFTYGIPFELEEESQDYGYYIYSVPNIRRFTYYTYPWWDNNTLLYPAESSIQYLFVTIANTPIPYPVKLDQFPFYVEEPNDPTMEGWYNYAGRSFVNDQAVLHGLQPVMTLDWTDLSGGSSMNIQTGIEDKTSNQQTRKWDFEVEAGGGATIKIPKICTVKAEQMVQAGYSGSLLNETMTTSEYGHRIFASLDKLHFASSGPNVGGLHLWAFLFTPETNPDWWYFDSLDGQKPFYLSWMVHSASQSLELKTPANKIRLEQNKLFFTWMPDKGELHDYELLISKSSNISYYNSVYRKQLGRATALSAPDFQPEPGETYYWAVQAYDEEGQRVYSPIWSFTVAKEDEKALEASLKAVVYPNPAKSNDIKIAIGPMTGGELLVQLLDVNGVVLSSEQMNIQEGSASVISFPGLDLPAGIYLAVIRSENEQLVRKVVVR